jgi:hypothetical protein
MFFQYPKGLSIKSAFSGIAPHQWELSASTQGELETLRALWNRDCYLMIGDVVYFNLVLEEQRG